MSLRAKHNLKTKIARIIFEKMSDIDGDLADWLHYREDCESAAQEIIDKYLTQSQEKTGRGGASRR